MRKNERLLNLVSFLLKAGRLVTWSVIRRDVDGYNNLSESDGAVERRFERDKSALRRMGVPLSYSSGDEADVAGYAIAPGSYFLPHLELSPEEVTILAFVARSARTQAAGPLNEALQTALQKLQFDSPIPGDIRATAEERYLFHHAAARPDSDNDRRLETLTAAVLANHTVHFMYRAADGEGATPRAVDPYGLAYWRGRWYLVGRAHEREAVRSFRTDRIVGEIAVLRPGGPADFEIPRGFRVEDHVGRPPWELVPKEPTRVAVHFDATVGWMVKDSALAGDRWQDDKDGGATLERTVSDSDALLRWLLRFGRHAELLRPRGLRERLCAQLREVRAMYRSAAAGEA